MSFNRKFFGICAVAILLAGTVFFIRSKPPELSEANVNEGQDAIDVPAGFTLHKNESCGVSFLLPVGWEERGYLGESRIVSPEDIEAGDDRRSLYVSCQYDVEQFLEGDFKISQWYEAEYSRTLSGVFNHPAFVSNNPQIKILRELEIAGRTAHEHTLTTVMPDKSLAILYKMVLENNGRVMEIEVGRVPLVEKSVEVQRIIESMKF